MSVHPPDSVRAPSEADAAQRSRLIRAPVREMHTSVLWEPEEGRCTQCGNRHLRARLYTDGHASTRFCRSCWTSFMNECNVTYEPLREGVSSAWDDAVTFRLEFDGDADADGAPQEASRWN